jgi:hypothetical protein
LNFSLKNSPKVVDFVLPDDEEVEEQSEKVVIDEFFKGALITREGTLYDDE